MSVGGEIGSVNQATSVIGEEILVVEEVQGPHFHSASLTVLGKWVKGPLL